VRESPDLLWPVVCHARGVFVSRRRYAGRCRDSHSRAFDLRADVTALFIVPGCLVISCAFRVEAGEKTVFWQLETVFNNEGRVGVVD
jgi:hypothetical protein